ncbi:MAG: TonB-dependent receptor [Sphingobacterium sp.]|jgi:TonB-linked SusC/RagA family outer membrane protein|uniref:SusC/RagA family TonB-linked outer membrane protein n=1 Tax=Sphingobacterium sp. TaxID=341027 RepID=UPI00284DF116|nr:TonB-dependent receptor [Sphingobacterium sp.]MDR3007559.1 TonB-dependent receptor [Sphingobacterium sp.]
MRNNKLKPFDGIKFSLFRSKQQRKDLLHSDGVRDVPYYNWRSRANIGFLLVFISTTIQANDSDATTTVLLDSSGKQVQWIPQRSIAVIGKVLDERGVPITGVTVRMKSSSMVVSTDQSGSYAFKDIPENAVLVFVYVGKKSQEVQVNGRTKIDVVLADNTLMMDEVVAIGYGTTKRKDLTGSVASINAEQLKDLPTVSVLQAISGRLPGVNVTITEGSPDAQIKVRVRGGSSITQDNSPLYIVDGFRVANINDIPMADIENIDVLKDAASTAIYGSEGANGVILITTKSGKGGSPKITFNSYLAASKVYNLTEVLSPYEYVYWQRELDPSIAANNSFNSMYGLWEDVDIYKSKGGLNWQDKLYGNTGLQQNYSLGMTGGDKDGSLTYNLNYTHDNEDYIMLNSAYQRDYVSAKLNKKISPKLSFEFNSRMSNTKITGPSISDGRKLREAVKYAPVRSLASLTEGALGGAEDITSAEALSSLNDPVVNVVNEYKDQHRFNLIFNTGLNWKITRGLSFNAKGSYGFNKNFTDNIWIKGTGQSSANGGQPVARREDQKGALWSFQNVLTYDFKLQENKHRFTIVGGQEMTNSEQNDMLLESKFYPKDFSTDDVLAMWNYGIPSPTYTTIREPSRTTSFFSRINYTFSDRYILTLTGRADGKNVFATGNQWGFFPGAAFAWRFSDESFMSGTKAWLSDAKLRLSHGSVGNARVGSYWRQDYDFINAANQLYYIGETPQSALRTKTTLKNENLTWESTVSSNIGLDLSLFKNRLNLTVDAYNNITNDLILQVPLPSSSGYANQYQNVGSTSNRGIEFSASAVLVEKKDFRLSADFNIAFNRNKIRKLIDGLNEMTTPASPWLDFGRDDFRAIVGQPLGLMYGFKQDGFYSFDDFTFDGTQNRWLLNEGVVDASKVMSRGGNYFGPGHIKLEKLGGEGQVITLEDDRAVIGQAQPKHTGGLMLNVQYKSFDLVGMFNWSYGNDIYNADKIDFMAYEGSKRYQNISNDMRLSQRFTTINPTTGANIMFGNDANPELFRALNEGKTMWNPMAANGRILTDWAIEDGSFLRLSNVTLGYTLPTRIAKRLLMQNLRIYVAGYNLHVWTKYSGQDPEVDTQRNPLTPGVGYSAYPKARKVLFGLNVTF